MESGEFVQLHRMVVDYIRNKSPDNITKSFEYFSEEFNDYKELIKKHFNFSDEAIIQGYEAMFASRYNIPKKRWWQR